MEWFFLNHRASFEMVLFWWVLPVIEIEVILSDKKIIKCSRETNKEIFKSVIGGLGLIGIITKVKLKLKKRVRLLKIIIEEKFHLKKEKEVLFMLIMEKNI